MSYSNAEREQALTLYVEIGTAEASRQTGITPRTIRRWANQADLSAARDLALEEGGKRLQKTHLVMREELRVLLLEKAVDLMERMDQEHIEYKAAGAEMHRLVYPIATSGDVRNYASSVKDLIDKYRLEMGEHTDRTQTITLGMVERSIEELNAQLRPSPN